MKENTVSLFIVEILLTFRQYRGYIFAFFSLHLLRNGCLGAALFASRIYIRHLIYVISREEITYDHPIRVVACL